MRHLQPGNACVADVDGGDGADDEGDACAVGEDGACAVCGNAAEVAEEVAGSGRVLRNNKIVGSWRSSRHISLCLLVLIHSCSISQGCMHSLKNTRMGD